MAGIYVHIPFCQSRCIYCDFFSTTALGQRGEYVDALTQEIANRREELAGDGGMGSNAVETIYIGGGTPSQLSIQHIRHILDSIRSCYAVAPMAEVTMECNPEDISESFSEALAGLGINRVSMGVQTFDDARLRFLKRRHSREKAIEAVSVLKRTGFRNISIDLMFGFPGETQADWDADLTMAISLDVPHISAYSLMYEEGTPLTRLRAAGKLRPLGEEQMLGMYNKLVDRLEMAGYSHYELSNFSKPQYASRHNMSYWTGVPYLGFGAGAHSYDGVHRRWNVSSVSQYIHGLSTGGEYYEFETLSDEDRYNEYVMTRLRTRMGMDVATLKHEFGEKIDFDEFEQTLQRHISMGTLVVADGRVRLSRKGQYVSDDVMSDFFVV